MSNPVRVTVTGAAGQIGYSLVFRIASGQLLGPDQPVDLRLLEIPPAMGALEGVAMEIVDCAFPLLSGLDLHEDPEDAFDGVNIALLVGSRPRTKGMERAELLSENGKIFTVQGKALNEKAADDVKVLVVGNPANTNCLIAMNNAQDIPNERFTAMLRLDHNRAIAQLAAKLEVPVTDVTQMGVWGNHSPTMYPDLFHAQVRGGQAAAAVDDQVWIEEDFLPNVGKRGAAIIEARGSSSAASAANAAIDHVYDWVNGTEDWVSMGVPSDGSYGVPEGLISGFPCTCANGEWSIVEGLDLDEFSRGKIDASVAELTDERDTVKGQGLISPKEKGAAPLPRPFRISMPSVEVEVRRIGVPGKDAVSDVCSAHVLADRRSHRSPIGKDAARGSETRTWGASRGLSSPAFRPAPTREARGRGSSA